MKKTESHELMRKKEKKVQMLEALLGLCRCRRVWCVGGLGGM